MKLKPGQKAPSFTVVDIYGKTIELSHYSGKKLHLGFFRNVSCPFCNLRIHQLSKINSQLKDNGLEVLYFFESKPEVIRRSTFHQGVSPIPLIGDHEKKIYTLYGVEASLLKAAATLFAKNSIRDFREGQSLGLPTDNNATQSLMPADFLIDENLTIVKAYYGQHMNDHIPMEHIKAFSTAASITEVMI